MCEFFSCVSDGKGKVYYFDALIRAKILAGELSYSQDSHTSIADYYGYKGAKEDTLNKYEYNPITKLFQVDRLNTTDDSKQVELFCNKLDFATVVPELRIKTIFHPFRDRERKRVTSKNKAQLKQWASVRDSVRASVRDSVWDSVRASVRDSVWDSVGDSVWASVWAYISSFFSLKKWKYIDHPKGENPFQPCIDLWESGLVPSFDGKTWRLHGVRGRILYEVAKEDL